MDYSQAGKHPYLSHLFAKLNFYIFDLKKVQSIKCVGSSFKST